MADIIRFPTDEAVAADERDETARDTFLIDEGLDLLAAFRSIEDANLRASIMMLVKTTASSVRRNAARG